MSAETHAPAYTPGPWVYDGRSVCAEITTRESDQPLVLKAGMRYRHQVAQAVSPNNGPLIAAAPTMVETLLSIRERLHPKALGRAATDAELLAITLATKALHEAGMIPSPLISGPRHE